MERPANSAPYGGVSVSSTLALNVTSWHHNQRVICQAYSPVLGEGANTFFQLDVLCESMSGSFPSSLVCFPGSSWCDQKLCCAQTFHNNSECFAEVLFYRNASLSNVCVRACVFTGLLEPFVAICRSVELGGSVS